MEIQVCPYCENVYFDQYWDGMVCALCQALVCTRDWVCEIRVYLVGLNLALGDTHRGAGLGWGSSHSWSWRWDWGGFVKDLRDNADACPNGSKYCSYEKVLKNGFKIFLFGGGALFTFSLSANLWPQMSKMPTGNILEWSGQIHPII